MGILSLFRGRGRSVVHQACQGVISVYERTVGDRTSSQEHHYPSAACASLLGSESKPPCPAPGHDIAGMGWNSERSSHTAPGSTLSGHCKILTLSLGETRAQGYHSSKAAGLISVCLDSCRSQRNCPRPEQGHTFLRTALVDSPATFKCMHTDTALGYFQPKPLYDLLFVQFTVSKGGETEGDFCVPGKSPCFKDK